MAVQVGSGIVKDGLVLHLDASDRLNYLLSSVEVLVVAGGGGGGVCYGGGGGGGGVVYRKDFPVTPGASTLVTVGGGGSNQSNTSGNGGQGGNSSFGSIVATGGGYGGGNCGNAGGSGGSGGGGSGNGSSRVGAGAGIAGQGFDGETSIVFGGGGGGGAGSRGYQRSGGDGLPYSISGTLRYYGGGGTGGGPEELPGGSGGGGMGMTAMPAGRGDGRPNTGGGGGGSIISGGVGVSGLGGSGVVIVRYPGPQKASGGDSIQFINGYTVHTFTTVGSVNFTPFTMPANTGAVYGLQDLSGNSQGPAVQSGGVTYSTSNSGVFVFDGSNDHLSVGNTDTLRPLYELTIGMWIKANSITSGWVRLFGQNPYQGGPLIFLETGGSLIRALHYPNGSEVRCNTNYSISTTSYTHAVFTFKMGDAIRSYFNGSPSTTVSLSPGVFTYNTANPYLIGHQGASWFNGNISNVTFYNKALSESEIQQNFNALRGRFGV